MPGIGRADAAGPLVAVERERVVAAALGNPERLVESHGERRRLAVEPLREVVLPPRGARQLRETKLCVVNVALDLGRRDRRRGKAAVAEPLRVAGILPRVVLEPLRAPLVLHEAVAVAVAVLVDPGERPEGGLAKTSCDLCVTRPAPHLGEQDEVQRCRIDRAVVPGEPLLRGPAGAQLVNDLPRLRVDPRVVDLRLEVGQGRERAHAQLRAEEHRLQAGDDRVAAEDRHEPRHTRCGQHSSISVAKSKGGQVRDGLVEGVVEVVPCGLETREAERPGLE